MESGPAHDGGDDDPDVVGLPDRGDCVVDEATGPLAALRTAGGEAPETGAVVGAAEHGVHDHGDPEDAGGGGCHQTPTFSPPGAAPSSPTRTGPRGPQGTSESAPSAWARHRPARPP